jgi:hypothetical protein
LSRVALVAFALLWVFVGSTVAFVPPATQQHTAAPKPATPSQRPGATTAAQMPVRYGGCWAEVPKMHSTYFSAVFPIQGNTPAPRAAYQAFVTQNYGQVGVSNCFVLQTADQAQEELRTLEATAQPRDRVVETGWKYQ